MSGMEIPLFPLQTVLFPGSLLPLRIFETRYLDMIRDCMKSGAGFGVCLIREGSETDAAAVCYPLGTCAEITDWTRYEDGLLGITARGTARFRLLETAVRSNNLITGRIESLAEVAGPDNVPGLEVIRSVYRAILENYNTPYQAGETAQLTGSVLCYRLADLLPLDTSLKQRILESSDMQTLVETLIAVIKSSNLIDEKPSD